jgi:O-antigen/teichoic acid export membrane protein
MFIVSYFLGNGSVGLYSVAVSIAERIWMFSASIASVLFSTVSGMGDDIIKIKLTSTACRNVFFISLIVSGVLFAASGLLIKYTLGNDFNETALLLRLILPGIAAGSIAKVLSNYVAAVGKPEINLYISLLSVSCSIILDLVFIPRYGIIVAPIVSSLTYVLSAVIVAIYYKQKTRNSYRTILIINKSDIRKYSALIRKILHIKERIV